MHARETVELVLRDHQPGIPSARIARQRRVPRSTVRDWCAGRIPQREAVDPWLAPDFPGEAYSRLLGTYLGDGWLTAEPRTMLLRIAFDASYPGLIAEARLETREGTGCRTILFRPPTARRALNARRTTPGCELPG